MKKQYSAPTLTVHGNVESITQFGGGSTRNDFLFFNASPIAQGQGVDTKVKVTEPCGSVDLYCPRP